MKKTYTFINKDKTNLFMSCPRCNSIHQIMAEQTNPKTDTPYHIECKKCHLEGDDGRTEKEAEAAWADLKMNYTGEEWHGEV